MMKAQIELKINGGDNKDKVVKALTESGYVVGVTYVEPDRYKSDTHYWSIAIYDNEQSVKELIKDLNIKATTVPNSDIDVEHIVELAISRINEKLNEEFKFN